MSTKISQESLSRALEAIAAAYSDFIDVNSCTAPASAAVQATILSIVSGISGAEQNGGSYTTRVVSVLPSCDNPTVTLNLLYRAAESANDLWSVSVSLVPNPNARGYLVLSSNVPYITNSDGLVPNNNVACAINVYAPLAVNTSAGGEVIVVSCGSDGSCGSVGTSGGTASCGSGCNSGACDTLGCDFPAYLCSTLGAPFSIRRDCKCCLYLLTAAATLTIGCKIVRPRKTLNGMSYYNYEKLQDMYLKNNPCAKFRKCDTTQIVSYTQCYEIWVSCESSALTLWFTYVNYRRVPRAFRKLIETATFTSSSLVPVTPLTPTTPQVPQANPAACDSVQYCTPSSSAGAVLGSSSYQIVTSLWCCCKEKWDPCNYCNCCSTHRAGAKASKHSGGKKSSSSKSCGANQYGCSSEESCSSSSECCSSDDSCCSEESCCSDDEPDCPSSTTTTITTSTHKKGGKSSKSCAQNPIVANPPACPAGGGLFGIF